MIISENLCFEYTRADDTSAAPIGDPALSSVNIRVSAGEFVAILGRNGSGKSTLARHLNALLTPTAGTLWIKGMDTSESAHTWDIRRTTGMVFQNPDNQLIATIVEEDVAFGPENLGIPSEEIRVRVDDSLAAVRMTEYAMAAPHQLSGGQKQRVAIAGVLAMKPDCIVLDEPTAMLDPSGRREVLETARNLHREHGITVILITHFMEEAALAERVMVMSDGAVVMDGDPRSVFRRVADMKALGLDVPQVTALAHILIEQGVPVTDIPLTVDEFLQDARIQEWIGV